MNETKVTISMPQPDEILSPKLDVCFKMLFGSERNKAILIDFLKSIISESVDDIEELTLLNPMTDKEFLSDKQGILDVKVRLRSGTLANLEIQVLNTKEMPERIIFYVSKIYTQQIGTGNQYRELRKAVSIVLTDFDLIPGCRDYYNRFWLINPNNGVKLSDIIEIHTLELGKLPKESDGSTRYEWVKFLSADMEEMEMISGNNHAIKLAYEELQKISLDSEKRELYEARLKNLLDEESRLRSAIEEGLERGKTEGRAQGRAEGRAEGLVEGIEKKQKEIVCNMLNIGLTLEIISKATGLGISEIEAISRNHGNLIKDAINHDK